VSFVIDEGEAVGLIGRNGAGKSTLLKLLTRVTRPSAGHADLYGRVGALLEVGTGFHPELTGRENAFLSGAILGLTKRDVAARFDDIVAFAEVAPFVDMPVKHYSSGMYARLGFAVAAFLRPAVLIVDEVLAVGDIAFQAKCLAHMKELSTSGTTVLFVSHNLLAVADFCPRALVMNDGRLTFDGPVASAVTEYRRSIPKSVERPAVGGTSVLQPLSINGSRVFGSTETAPNDPILVECILELPSDALGTDVTVNLHVESPDGRPAVHLRSDFNGQVISIGPGLNRLGVQIDDLSLAPGQYWLWLRVVTLNPRGPAIWDTERTVLLITGNQVLSSIAMPRHRFVSVASNTRRQHH